LFSLLFFLSNSGVPPSLSFLAEFITISRGLSFLDIRFFIIFIYFAVSFYYSIYIITNCVIGKNFTILNSWNVGMSVPLILISYNIFWFGLFL